MVEVCGEVDAATIPEVAAALDRALDRPAIHVVVCMSGVMFCAARGLAMVVDAGREAADRGIGFSVSGASGQMRRLWSLLWAPDQRPAQFADVGGAVLDALQVPAVPPRAAAAAARQSVGHR
jgi:anti-anti-sigma factor